MNIKNTILNNEILIIALFAVFSFAITSIVPVIGFFLLLLSFFVLLNIIANKSQKN